MGSCAYPQSSVAPVTSCPGFSTVKTIEDSPPERAASLSSRHAFRSLPRLLGALDRGGCAMYCSPLAVNSFGHGGVRRGLFSPAERNSHGSAHFSRVRGGSSHQGQARSRIPVHILKKGSQGGRTWLEGLDDVLSVLLAEDGIVPGTREAGDSEEHSRPLEGCCARVKPCDRCLAEAVLISTPHPRQDSPP